MRGQAGLPGGPQGPALGKAPRPCAAAAPPPPSPPASGLPAPTAASPRKRLRAWFQSVSIPRFCCPPPPPPPPTPHPPTHPPPPPPTHHTPPPPPPPPTHPQPSMHARGRTWFNPSQSHASAISLVSLSTGSEVIISMRGGSVSGVPVGTPAPSVMKLGGTGRRVGRGRGGVQ